MSISIADFWRLLGESRLLAPEQIGQLAADFGQLKGAAEGASGKTLAQWLVSRNVLSRYQTTILLAGRAGPFHYGDYKVYDRVDSGRLAGQFRAVHAPSGHPVLLQFLTGAVITDPQAWAAAANEALAAARIASPHVQRFFEPVDLQSFKFLVSEDLRGETLDQRLAAGRFPPAEAARIVRLAVIGLTQMHQCGRIHGDIRPANVLLEPIANHPGNVKLLFDGAQAPAPIDFTQQQPGGSLAQMADNLAPELLHPGKTPDPLSDVYALGCTLYGMLSGNPPFAGGNVQQKMARHAGEAIRPLEMFGVPQPLAQIVAYMMAKNPAVRLQSAAIVAEQLAAFVNPGVIYLPPPQPPATLAAYEHSIRQQQARLAQPQPLVVKPVAPAAEGPLPFRTDREHLGTLAQAVATAPPPAFGGGVQLAGAARQATRPDEIVRRREAEQKRNVIVALVVAGVVVVTAIVAFNLSGRRNSPLASGGSGNRTAGAPAPAAVDNTGLSPAITPTSANGGGSSSNPVAAATDGADPPRQTPAAAALKVPGLVQEVVADDGASLWASPTSGPPVSFRCVPPEAQIFLIVRPAEILAEPEGERVLAALGPTFAAQRATWENAAGVKLGEIEQLTISLHNNDAKFPRTAFVVRTNQPISREQLLTKWGNPAAVQEKGQTYYTGANWAYYIPADERMFAMGESRDIKEVAAMAGNPPQVFRDVERLCQTTDERRHFTLLFYPQFLFNDDGEPLFAAERAKVRKPLEWLLGDHLQAAAVSGQLGESFYFELRMQSSLDKRPLQLAEELKARLNEIPPSLEDYFVSLSPPSYWKKLAFRYPGMIRELHGQMRVGVESEQAIVNSVLPAAAAHNLVLGGELLVATAPGPALDVAVAQPVAGPKTIEEALQLKTSYTFDSQSLEFAMRDLAADVQDNAKGLDFKIKLIGPDLEKDGITRNQSIRDFKQENQPVADILTALVLKANPIPGKSAADKDQKLIWVVGPDPDGGKPAVLITTRAAAAAKQYKLPEPFVMK